MSRPRPDWSGLALHASIGAKNNNDIRFVRPTKLGFEIFLAGFDGRNTERIDHGEMPAPCSAGARPRKPSRSQTSSAAVVAAAQGAF